MRLLRIFGLLLVTLLLSACAEPPYGELDSVQVMEQITQGVPVVDIRRAEEWRETGVLRDSLQMTFIDRVGRLTPQFLENFTRRFAKDEPVVLICRSGNRTDALGRLLVEQLGYTRVYVARDGISRWIRDGLPVVPAEG